MHGTGGHNSRMGMSTCYLLLSMLAGHGRAGLREASGLEDQRGRQPPLRATVVVYH
jgi:hypothetical protein